MIPDFWYTFIGLRKQPFIAREPDDERVWYPLWTGETLMSMLEDIKERVNKVVYLVPQESQDGVRQMKEDLKWCIYRIEEYQKMLEEKESA